MTFTSLLIPESTSPGGHMPNVKLLLNMKRMEASVFFPESRRKAKRDQIWKVQNNVNSARCGWLSGALTMVSLF
ncbi:hypothetical protein SAMN04488109_4108 [Chryseolinea serpens]|uniref:Uncharacterized protein n=1 Tax=Chryseolinea serpens TaxID=947013 RepID=A0A1M5TJ13_9BACT|nr:hypothetical protein SAMN04488109_4108 [Chryseolinea serpens]